MDKKGVAWLEWLRGAFSFFVNTLCRFGWLGEPSSYPPTNGANVARHAEFLITTPHLDWRNASEGAALIDATITVVTGGGTLLISFGAGPNMAAILWPAASRNHCLASRLSVPYHTIFYPKTGWV